MKQELNDIVNNELKSSFAWLVFILCCVADLVFSYFLGLNHQAVISIIFFNISCASIFLLIQAYLKAKMLLIEESNKIVLENINNKIGEIKTPEELKDYVFRSELLGYIEGNIKGKHKIYLQTSTFKLEKTTFKETIVNNLRKGVIYHYLVEAEILNGGKKLPEEFKDVVKDFWKQYSSFLKEDGLKNLINHNSKENWDRKYQKYLIDACQHFKDPKQQLPSKEDVFNSFKNRFKIYYTKNISYAVTIALYQVDQNKWKGIVKLPTQYANISEGYSYSLFGTKEITEEQTSFVKDFRKNFGKYNNEIKEDDYKKIIFED